MHIRKLTGNFLACGLILALFAGTSGSGLSMGIESGQTAGPTIALNSAYTSLPHGAGLSEAANPADPGTAGAAAPYPPSPVIPSLQWAPASSVLRFAHGSDNWPVTWADDDSLIGAYGDGWGFGEKTTQKLSLGFSKIVGNGNNLTGTNIPSSGEQLGQGALGKKASGLLMVDGVLYMWVRNADQNGQGCQLAWSTDRAKSWTWSNWKLMEFGYCTFINYGKNYSGARDEYVYTVTPDHPSAYRGSDQFVLLRVPKAKLKDLNAYEYFRGLDEGGEPVWTGDMNEREAVFTNPGRALRSGITYNAALGRYLWWQGYPHEGDERNEGGFGVFDAPEPWGPWTTVYSTEAWDMGPGETGSFPTRWMSSDGKTMTLLFSGEDAFSLRQATIQKLNLDNLSVQTFLPLMIDERR